jgi:hypothetical protein
MNASNQHPTYRAALFLVKGFAVRTGGATVFLILYYSTGPWSTLDAGSPGADAKAEARPVKIYDADPTHLWNRLHSALFVRTGSDGKSYGQDELDPLLWPRSKFLVAGEQHKYVVALLDEFLARDSHKLITDPLKRAVFPHDLWAIFDWLANPTAPYQYREDEAASGARALQIRLAKIIRRLALSDEQVQQLPDNYTRHGRDWHDCGAQCRGVN